MPNSPAQASAFIHLLNAHYNRLYGYLYSLVLNYDDAEDLYQEVATLLWQKFDQYEPNTDFGRWAIRVAHFKVKNFPRRRSRVRYTDEVLDQVMETQAAVDSEVAAERTAALARCLEGLSAADRELVQTCYGGDFKIREVARRDGRSADAIYSALYRIRKALLKCIEHKVRREVML